jgi:hypothetical protein
VAARQPVAGMREEGSADDRAVRPQVARTDLEGLAAALEVAIEDLRGFRTERPEGPDAVRTTKRSESVLRPAESRSTMASS